MNPDRQYFLAGGVVEGGFRPVEIAFQTLLLERGISFSDFYHSKEISLDKSYASKIRRGLIIPPLFLRIKIAAFFKVDTSVIWPFYKNFGEKNEDH